MSTHNEVEFWDRHKIKHVPCESCGEETDATALKECARCWELRVRIEGQPELARTILARIDKEKLL